jgi:hypothetical protein
LLLLEYVNAIPTHLLKLFRPNTVVGKQTTLVPTHAKMIDK